MKKYILLVSVLLGGIFFACDYNDRNFEGLDDLATPPNLISEKYTITDADITAIVGALRADGKEEIANIFNADKMFSEAAPASDLVPYLLKSKYKSVDLKSTVDVTYKYKEGRNETLTGLSTEKYMIAADDYKSVWGEPYAETFTPEKSPEKELPTILKSRFADAAEGTFKNVEYYYSNEEPEVSVVAKNFLDEPFEGYEAGSGKVVTIEGWTNVDLSGTRSWECRSFSGNNYAQVTSNGSKSVNDVWLITTAVDLTDATAPKFSFNVTAGYYNAPCLSVLISENFDGNADNINPAQWTNVTDNFELPTGPSGGYGTLSPAGTMDLSAYKGKKIYIAFRYQGDDTTTEKKTTTFQIDKVQVSEEVVGIAVKEKSLQYAAYRYDGSKWAKASSSIVTLQPEDYTMMGYNYLSASQAAERLPAWLKYKFPLAVNGDVKSVVYKTNASSAYYADEYQFDAEAAKWIINSFVVENTDQFIYAEKGWMFDPTIVANLQDATTGKAEYQLIVDYVKANQAVENPALSIYADSEYYYGFAGRYQNVSYRDKDRSADPLYPIDGTNADKEAFCNARTIEGLQLYLTLRYPDAQPTVNGVAQMAEVTVKVYSSHIHNYDNEIWTYTFECTGNKEWKFVGRVSENGTIEKAE